MQLMSDLNCNNVTDLFHPETWENDCLKRFMIEPLKASLTRPLHFNATKPITLQRNGTNEIDGAAGIRQQGDDRTHFCRRAVTFTVHSIQRALAHIP
jgi:hypothetical protein